MKDAIKRNNKGPRFRPPRLETTSSEWLSEIADSEDCLVKDVDKIKKIIIATNQAIANTVIECRDGIELPEQLGYMFLGTCQPKIRKNVDFKQTDHYLKVIQHRNWESDNYLAKIFYTNYETKYKFKFNDMWGFKACRDFTKTVGREYPKNWKMYIQVDHTLKISKLYRSYIAQTEREQIDRERLDDYNALELD
jgi:hypothetical protein